MLAVYRARCAADDYYSIAFYASLAVAFRGHTTGQLSTQFCFGRFIKRESGLGLAFALAVIERAMVMIMMRVSTRMKCAIVIAHSFATCCTFAHSCAVDRAQNLSLTNTLAVSVAGQPLCTTFSSKQ